MTGFPSLFDRIAKAGELPADVTPHVLRHSFASLANDLGYSEATIGMLIGHKGSGSTARGLSRKGQPRAVLPSKRERDSGAQIFFRVPEELGRPARNGCVTPPTISTAGACPQQEVAMHPIPDSPDALLTRQRTAEALTAAGYPISHRTLATKATRGGGPLYSLFSGRALYRWGDALGWAVSMTSAPRSSTSEMDALRQG